MEAQQDFIRQHVKLIAAKRKGGPPTYKAVIEPRQEKVKEKVSDKLSGVLVVCIFVVSLAILIVMFMMSDKGKELWAKVRASDQATSSASPLPEAGTLPGSTEYMRKDETHQFIATANKRLNNLEREVKVWAHRTWVVGVAANENAVLCDQMNIDHHNVANRGFVRIGENWTLAPAPKNLPGLNDEDKKELQEGVK